MFARSASPSRREWCNKKAATFVAAFSGAPSGTLPRAKKRRTGAFLPAGPAAGPSCSRHPMVHQIEPSLKDCNKKRAAISCNAYFGAPSGTRTQDPLIKSQLLYQLSSWCLIKQTHEPGFPLGPWAACFLREAGIYLFSQAVSSQLSSAQVSLTSVFGMGTGGSSPSSTPAIPDLRQLLFLRRHIPSKLNIELLSANEVSIENGVKPSTY